MSPDGPGHPTGSCPPAARSSTLGSSHVSDLPDFLVDSRKMIPIEVSTDFGFPLPDAESAIAMSLSNPGRCTERTKPALRNGLEVVRARLVSEREAIEQADEKAASNLGLRIEVVASPVLKMITAAVAQCDLYLASIEDETDLSKLNSKAEFCLA
jgi:hypothetical protein